MVQILVIFSEQSICSDLIVCQVHKAKVDSSWQKSLVNNLFVLGLLINIISYLLHRFKQMFIQRISSNNFCTVSEMRPFSLASYITSMSSLNLPLTLRTVLKECGKKTVCKFPLHKNIPLCRICRTSLPQYETMSKVKTLITAKSVASACVSFCFGLCACVCVCVRVCVCIIIISPPIITTSHYASYASVKYKRGAIMCVYMFSSSFFVLL